MDSSQKLKIAFTYLAYPVAMARYMLEALYRRDDVEVATCGAFSNTWIPWKSGIFLPTTYLRKPDYPLPSGSPINYHWLAKQLPWVPDVWLEGNAGMATQDTPPGFYAVIGTDPHVIDYSRQRVAANVFFCMQKPYMKPGDIWLPYGYDPHWHQRTTKAWAEREYDVSLIGLMYQQRTELMERLKTEGRKVFYDTGPAYEDAARIYHGTRIGLNWSSRLDTTARVFELMAFGIPAVLNRVPDLMEMFVDGQDFAGFDNQDEAVAVINHLLADPKTAQELGAAGRKAVEPHTWDARMDYVLKVIRDRI